MPVDLRHLVAAVYAVVFFNLISVIVISKAIKD